MSARLQTWFPLTIQVCLNGRECLARQLDQEGIAFQKRGNCFTWIEDLPRTQEIMDRLLRTPWPALLDEIAGQLNPIHRELFGDFKVLRRKQGDPHGDLAWRPWRKGVADLHRRAQVSEAANQRYLEALACVQDTASLGSLTEKLCRPTTWKGKRVRALNPYGPEDLALLQAVARGEFNLNGFRNRDLVKLLFPSDQELTSTEKRRQSGAITRKLRLLRAHGLIKKVPKTHRYHLTTSGSKVITAIIAALQASSDSLIKLAA